MVIPMAFSTRPDGPGCSKRNAHESVDDLINAEQPGQAAGLLPAESAVKSPHSRLAPKARQDQRFL